MLPRSKNTFQFVYGSKSLLPNLLQYLQIKGAHRICRKEFVVAGEWGRRKTSICCLHHTSNPSLGQIKCSPSKVPTLAKRLKQQVLAGNISADTRDVQSRRNLISGCLHRSLRGNKARFNPPQLSPQWPFKSYISSHLTSRIHGLTLNVFAMNISCKITSSALLCTM